MELNVRECEPGDIVLLKTGEYFLITPAGWWDGDEVEGISLTHEDTYDSDWGAETSIPASMLDSIQYTERG